MTAAATFLALHPWIDAWLVWACVACWLASTIDAVLPQPAPGSHWLPLRKLVSLVALNVGNATNGRQPALRSWLERVLVIALRASPAGSAAAFAGTILFSVVMGPAAAPTPSSPPKNS